MKVYAAYNHDVVRLDSSSGGIFAALANEFDIVYGVSLSEDNRKAIYSRAYRNIKPLIGSKYMQAKPMDVMKNVKQDLENSNTVLFVGTACYVNGLVRFLGKDYPGLVAIDIICHGVPSYKLWDKYVNNEDVYSVNFRSKDNGWKKYGLKINENFIPMESNNYMKVYLSNIALRESCYDCVCKKNKLSDITLGDYWGIQDIAPEMDDDKGISAVIIRTKKGQRLFDAVRGKISYIQTSYEDVIKHNPMENKSTSRPNERNDFYRKVNEMDFNGIYKEYIDRSLFNRMKRRVKSVRKK